MPLDRRSLATWTAAALPDPVLPMVFHVDIFCFMYAAQGHGVVADLFRMNEVEAGVKEAIEKMGGLDILVSNGT